MANNEREDLDRELLMAMSIVFLSEVEGVMEHFTVDEQAALGDFLEAHQFPDEKHPEHVLQRILAEIVAGKEEESES